MLVLHEPARLVGADRQIGEAEAAVSQEQIAEESAVAVTGIASVENLAPRGVDDESAPQSHAAVAQIACRPMQHRLEMHADAGPNVDAVAPIVGLGANLGIARAHDRIVAE